MKKQQIEEIEMILVIREFLEQWKVKTFEWYKDLKKQYSEKRKQEYEFNRENLIKVIGMDSGFMPRVTSNNIDEILQKYDSLYQLQKDNYKSSLNWMIFRKWCQFYPASTLDLCLRSNEDIMKVLEKEMIAKYVSLVSRIEKKTGKIVDASGLYIGMNGEINGVVVGEKGSVKVETVSAGGYNIQCWHFRVLVK